MPNILSACPFKLFDIFFLSFPFTFYISVQINSDQLIDLHKINNKNINVNLCKQRDKILYSAIVSIFVTTRRGKKNNLFSNITIQLNEMIKKTHTCFVIWFDFYFSFIIFFSTREYFDGHIKTLFYYLLIFVLRQCTHVIYSIFTCLPFRQQWHLISRK